MANTKSAKKRMRQNQKRRLRNRMTKSRIKTAVRAFLEAVRANQASLAREKFQLVQKLLDTAARKGILHRNTAARKKSRLQARLAKLQPA